MNTSRSHIQNNKQELGAESASGVESLAAPPSTHWRRRWFPTFVSMYRWWTRRLTRSGRTLFALLLVSLPGAFTEQRFALQVLGALTATYVGVGWMGRRHRPQLQVRLSMPEAIVCGALAELRVTLKNESDRVCYGLQVNLELTEEDVWQFDLRQQPRMPVVDLEPGEQATGVLLVRPRSRGRYALPRVRIATTFPLNLMLHSQVATANASVVVTPAYDPLLVAESVTGGASLLATVPETLIEKGDSWEYYGSREYQQGMAVRRWDYGAWARLGTPYVREYEEQTQANAALLIDTHVPALPASNAPADPSLEAAISLAAGLIQSLRKDRWQIHMLLAPGAEPWVQWEPSTNSQEALMERLAELQPATESWEAMDQRAAATTLPFWEMTIFIVVTRWDARRAAWCDAWRQRGADVRVLAPSSVGRRTKDAANLTTCSGAKPVQLVDTPYCRAGDRGGGA